MLLQHMLFFMGLALISIIYKKNILIIFLLAVCVELSQFLIPSRTPSIDDIVFGWLGVLLIYSPYRIYIEFKPKANIKELNKFCTDRLQVKF